MIDKTTADAVSNIVKKEKHKRPKRSEEYMPHTEPGDNTAYTTNMLSMWNWEKPDMNDKNAVSDRIEQYFRLCSDNDSKPSVAGLAFAFGVSRKTLWAWANGVDSKTLPESSRNLIKKAYYGLNLIMEDYMQNGKINPVAGIFLMKNNLAYKDETDIIITPNTAMGEAQEADVIAERYKLLPADDD